MIGREKATPPKPARAETAHRPVPPRRALPEMSPWRRQPLTIPPDSLRAWLRLGVWETWMGALLGGALGIGIRLIVTARDSIVTVYDFANCYAAPPVVQPCERVAYRAGELNMVFNAWCGLLLVCAGVWLLWELWCASAPKPITDDFLKLLDDSFGHNWRSLRTWPWARIGWAFGFPLAGAGLTVSLGLIVSMTMASSRFAKPPMPHIETSQRFRPVP
jgi:hypothetical protein